MKHISKKYLVLPIALLLTPPAWSNDAELDTIVVTATRTEQLQADSLSSVSVLTRQDIERLQTTDMYQVLSSIPGLSVSRTGAYGSSISVFLRGTATSQTLFLLDGQRINSATLGEPNLSFISPDQIERIEVVRGPRASLYGADAIGGVVHIFTKKGKQSASVSVSAGAGSNDLQQQQASINLPVTSTTQVNLGLTHEETSGINHSESDIMGSADDDAYRDSGVNLGISQQLSSNAEISLQYLKNKSQSEYDNNGGCLDVFFTNLPCQGFFDSTLENISVNGKVRINDFWKISTNMGRMNDESKNGDDMHNNPTAVYGIKNIFETTRTSFVLQNDFNIATGHLLTIGGDYIEDEIGGRVYMNNNVFGAPLFPSDYLDENGQPIDSRDNKAVFVQYQGENNGYSLVTGLRNDDNEQYGSKTTGNIAVGLPVTSHIKLVSSYGTAFKAPTFNDLYWPEGANPNLSPEKSHTTEIGLKNTDGSLHWEVNYFQTKMKDMIEWAPDPLNPPFWTPSNVEKAKIEGLEIIASHSVAEWLISGSLSVMNPEYEETVGGTNDGNTLVARPKNTLKVDLDRSWGLFDTGLSWMVESERYQDKANTHQTSGYGIVNLRTTYHLTKEVQLQLKIDNLLDKEYATRMYNYFDAFFNPVWGEYNTLGRTAFLSVTYTPAL